METNLRDFDFTDSSINIFITSTNECIIVLFSAFHFRRCFERKKEEKQTFCYKKRDCLKGFYQIRFTQKRI